MDGFVLVPKCELMDDLAAEMREEWAREDAEVAADLIAHISLRGFGQ